MGFLSDFSFVYEWLFYVFLVLSFILGGSKMRLNKRAEYYEQMAEFDDSNAEFNLMAETVKTVNGKMLNLNIIQISIYIASLIFMGVLSAVTLFIIHQIGSFNAFVRFRVS